MAVVAGLIGGFHGAPHELLSGDLGFARAVKAVFSHSILGSSLASALYAAVLFLGLLGVKVTKGTEKSHLVLPATIVAVAGMVNCAFFLGDLIHHAIN